MKKLSDFRKTTCEDIQEGAEEDKKLAALVRAGLFDTKKLSILKRAMDKSAKETTPQERGVLIDLLHRLIDVIDNNQVIYNKVRQTVHQEETITEGTTLKDPPALLIMRRKAIRMFPDGKRVVMYYIDQIAKYISIPYDEFGLNGGHANIPVVEEVDYLSEEPEEVNEISKGRLKSYVRKATKDVKKKSVDGALTAASSHPHANRLSNFHQRIADRRAANIAKAKKRLGEEPGTEAMEEEPINELSKKTLGSYVNSAAKQINYHSQDTGKYLERLGNGNIDKARNMRKADQSMTIADRRKAGIAQAVSKLTKEEPINELSKKTLGSYVKKATDDVSFHSFMAGVPRQKPENSLAHDSKSFKRKAGIEKAVDKLTETTKKSPLQKLRDFDKTRVAVGKKPIFKDDTEKKTVNEGVLKTLDDIASRGGSEDIRFTDGKKARIDSITAKAILNVHGAVSDANKKKLEDMINKDEANFNKVAAFAHGAHVS